MKKATLEALKASIKHWQENVKKAKTNSLYHVDISANSCPLCQLYDTRCYTVVTFGDTTKIECCPVMKKVGIKNDTCGCVSSPWKEVNTCFFARSATPKLVAAVKAELKFLKSLLPKKRKPK